MNPCERIARLNATTIRLDMGRGGKPDLTPQDIAGAIGMVKNVFAREVFCAIWWPDGAKLVWKQLDAMIAAAQFGEWKRRADELVTAQIRMAQAANDWHKHDMRQVKSMLDKAKVEMWPSLEQETYGYIRRGVMAEMRAPRMCPVCNGRCQITAGELLVLCERCNASGRIAVSDSQRAIMMKRDESTYRRRWKHVYEWTYRLVADAESIGREQISQCLDDAA